MSKSSEPLNLLCFSYAGGDARFYSRWNTLLPNINIIPVDIPGHGDVLNLPAVVSHDKLMDFLLENYSRYCTSSFALFGHSLGARIAFEYLSVLERRKGLKAKTLFISACLSPERFSEAMRKRELDLSDSTLLQVLSDLGGTPPELLKDEKVMNDALPLIRTDFRLAISLSKIPSIPVNTPLNLLFGSNDKVTYILDDYPGWEKYTSKECYFSVIDGDHFFIRSRSKYTAKLVGKILTELNYNESLR